MFSIHSVSSRTSKLSLSNGFSSRRPSSLPLFRGPASREGTQGSLWIHKRRESVRVLLFARPGGGEKGRGAEDPAAARAGLGPRWRETTKKTRQAARKKPRPLQVSSTPAPSTQSCRKKREYARRERAERRREKATAAAARARARGRSDRLPALFGEQAASAVFPFLRRPSFCSLRTRAHTHTHTHVHGPL